MPHTFRIVRVDWAGPFRWTTPTPAVPDELRSTLAGPGLYQVCANHITHGPDTLLYVGAAGYGEKSATEIGRRLKAHWVNWAQHEDRASLSFRLGVVRSVEALSGHEAAPLDGAQLRAVEALTIWWHSPPYNSQSKQHAQTKLADGERLLVQTVGARGRLAIEYSSAWDRAWDRRSE